MQVFVGWPYRPEYAWIEDYAVPLIQSYGVNVEHGKQLQGEKLGPEIQGKILRSDAVIIFMLPVEHEGGGPPRTSHWMVQELEYARAHDVKRIWVVRGEGVEVADEMYEKRQYRDLKRGEEMAFLVELGQTVSEWRGLTFRLKLLPPDFVELASQQLNRRDGYSCTYCLRQQGRQLGEPQAAELSPEGDELYVYARDLPLDIFNKPDVSLEVVVRLYDGGSWSRAGIRLTASEVTLRRG